MVSWTRLIVTLYLHFLSCLLLLLLFVSLLNLFTLFFCLCILPLLFSSPSFCLSLSHTSHAWTGWPHFLDCLYTQQPKRNSAKSGDFRYSLHCGRYVGDRGDPNGFLCAADQHRSLSISLLQHDNCLCACFIVFHLIPINLNFTDLIQFTVYCPDTTRNVKEHKIKFHTTHNSIWYTTRTSTWSVFPIWSISWNVGTAPLISDLGTINKTSGQLQSATDLLYEKKTTVRTE